MIQRERIGRRAVDAATVVLLEQLAEGPIDVLRVREQARAILIQMGAPPVPDTWAR